MWKTVVKWLVVVVAAIVMVVLILQNIDDYRAVDALYDKREEPAGAFGPPPVVPRSSQGNGDIDVWKSVEESP